MRLLRCRARCTRRLLLAGADSSNALISMNVQGNVCMKSVYVHPAVHGPCSALHCLHAHVRSNACISPCLCAPRMSVTTFQRASLQASAPFNFSNIYLLSSTATDRGKEGLQATHQLNPLGSEALDRRNGIMQAVTRRIEVFYWHPAQFNTAVSQHVQACMVHAAAAGPGGQRSPAGSPCDTPARKRAGSGQRCWPHTCHGLE